MLFVFNLLGVFLGLMVVTRVAQGEYLLAVLYFALLLWTARLWVSMNKFIQSKKGTK